MPSVTMPKDHPYTEGVTVNGETVLPGQSIDVDPDFAASLREQGWKTTAVKTAAKKTAPTKGDDKTASADNTKEP